MVAMGAADEEERPVHQGCMAGFLHLFDRPHILSGKRRLCHQPRRLLSSSSSGSATPSEMSMPLDRATPLPSSPEMTPPAAPRPSLQLPPLDLKDRGGAAASWRLPRLSLDSRAVVDARGKLRQRDNIRAASPAASPGMAGAPSVVARLMGLDALPHGAADEEDGQHVARGGELRRSASERVPRDPARFRFVDPSFFEKPAPPVLPQRPSSPTTEAAQAAQRRSPDPAFHRAAALQRRSSHFDAREVFPEPAKRVDSSAGRGEIALCGEIDRRLRKRGIAEPARDLETLKQILEALQLKGLLRHSTPPPPLSVRNHPPPIVIMRPSSRPPQPPTSPTRRIRVQVDNARRPRSPDRAASPARSPASPARRGPQSPQRRVSPDKRHQPLKKPNNADLPGVRSRIARHAAHNLSPDDDACTTFSDGGSNSSVSASVSTRWDLEQQRARLDDPRTDRGLLERCGKLLNSIQAFTSAGDVAADQQPSPVSVLDAATFLADEDSPSSSGSKRGMGRRAPSPRPVVSLSFPEDDDEVVPEAWLVGPEASDPDFAYVAEVVCLSDRMRSPDDVYRAVEKRRRRGEDTWQHRKLLCGAAVEALDRWRCAHPSEPVAWLRGEELLRYVWAEVQRAMEPAGPAAGDDLNDQTSGAILRDLAADRRWSPSAEAADAVLQIERLLFKDLVADAICELAEADRLRLPRRKLVF